MQNIEELPFVQDLVLTPTSDAIFNEDFGNMGVAINNPIHIGEKFLSFCKENLNCKVMDIGCANGYPVSIPALSLNAEVTCLDGDPPRIEELKRTVEAMDLDKSKAKIMCEFYPLTKEKITNDNTLGYYDAIFTSRTIHCGDAEHYKRCLECIYDQLKTNGTLFQETTHPMSENYTKVEGYTEAYEKRKAEGLEWPGLIEARDWLPKEWWGIGNVIQLTKEEIRKMIEEVGFVVEEVREDIMQQLGNKDIMVGVIARKP